MSQQSSTDIWPNKQTLTERNKRNRHLQLKLNLKVDKIKGN